MRIRQFGHDRGKPVEYAPCHARALRLQFGQTQVEESYFLPSDYGRARREEFAAAVAQMPRVLSQQSLDSGGVAAEKALQETLHHAPRLFLQRARRGPALPVVIAHRPPRAVMSGFDVRFAHAER